MQRRQKICVNSESAIGFSQNYRDEFWDVSSRSTIFWLWLNVCLRMRCINHKTAECCLRDSKQDCLRSISPTPLPPLLSPAFVNGNLVRCTAVLLGVGGICWKIKKYEKPKNRNPQKPETALSISKKTGRFILNKNWAMDSYFWATLDFWFGNRLKKLLHRVLHYCTCRR